MVSGFSGQGETMKVVVGHKKQNNKKFYMLLTESLTAWLLAAGIVLTAVQALGIEISRFFVLIVTLIPVLILELIPWEVFAEGASLLLVAGVVVLTLIGQKNFMNGLIVLNNCIAETVGKNRGISWPQYMLQSTETAGSDMMIAAGVFGLLVGMIMYWIVKYGKMWTVIMIAGLLAGIVVLTGNRVGIGETVLTVCGVLGMISVRIYGHGKSPVYGGLFEMALILYLFLIVFCGAGLLLHMTLNPQETYKKSGLTVRIQNKEKELLQSVRYENKKINSLPKGNLKKLGNWKATEDTALTVTMSEPQSLYLRGFTGTEYSSGVWQKMPNAEYYDAQNLFYWLHQGGFYGTAQLENARGLFRDSDLAAQDISVKVVNNHADSEYLYTPYELKEGSWKQEHLRQNADETLESTNFFGTRKYEFHTSGNLTKDFPALAAQTFLAMTENPGSDYEKNESYYNVFAYRHYTELTRSQKELMENLLGSAGEQQNGHIDYSSAINAVNSFFEKNITFNKECGSVPGGKDPVNYFLTESGNGYDIYYASAVVLMFRYYGIPSRYVEGYVITPEEAEDAKPDEQIKIPASDGHAWAEIYIDGTGWVPIEVSPDFKKVMQQPDLSTGIQAGTTAASAEGTVEDKQELSEKSLPELLKETMFDFLKILFVLFVGFDLIVLILFITSVVGRILAALKRRYAFRSEDNRRAVLAMLQYASDLILYGHEELYGQKKSKKASYLNKNYSKELSELYLKACVIGERAAFSRHTISEDEKVFVTEYIRQLRRDILKKAGWYERWMMRYIEKLC